MIGNAIGQFLGSLASGIGSHSANAMFGETLADRQRYALEQMAKQNEYNVENYKMQRDDQLRFTDPAFIRQRLERAGLSPSLALSNGASSPGLSTSIGSSSTAGGLGSSSLAHGANLMESIARIRNINQDTENKKTENDYNRESMQHRIAILSNEKTAGIFENQIKAIDAFYRDKINAVTISKIQQEIDTMAGNLANAKNLTEIERQRVQGYLDSITAQIALWKTEMGLNVAKTVTEGTQQGLNVAKTATEETQQGLNVALTSYWNAMPAKVKAEADLLARRANLTEQQAREVKNLIALRWSRFGVETAERISRETREWLYGWIPLRRQGEKMTVDMDKIREETRRLKNENDFWELNH